MSRPYAGERRPSRKRTKLCRPSGSPSAAAPQSDLDRLRRTRENASRHEKESVSLSPAALDYSLGCNHQ